MQLKKLREYLKFSQTDMATKLNMTQSSYAKLENNKLHASVDLLLKVLDLYPKEACYILSSKKKSISIIVHDNTDELPFSSMQELLEHIQELKQSLEHTELLLAKANTDKDNFFKMYIEAQFGIKNKKANTNDSSNNIDKTESKV